MSVRFGTDLIEVGVLGPGDFVNIGAILGTDELMHTVVAVTDCCAARIESAVLHELFGRHPELRTKLACYLQARINQTMALAACHARHSIEQRLASWILAATELVGDSEIKITHRQLSAQLGVQRTSVTVALEALEGYRAIWSRRGRLVVRECYKVHELACHCLTAQGCGGGVRSYGGDATVQDC